MEGPYSPVSVFRRVALRLLQTLLWPLVRRTLKMPTQLRNPCSPPGGRRPSGSPVVQSNRVPSFTIYGLRDQRGEKKCTLAAQPRGRADAVRPQFFNPARQDLGRPPRREHPGEFSINRHARSSPRLTRARGFWVSVGGERGQYGVGAGRRGGSRPDGQGQGAKSSSILASRRAAVARSPGVHRGLVAVGRRPHPRSPRPAPRWRRHPPPPGRSYGIAAGPLCDPHRPARRRGRRRHAPRPAPRFLVRGSSQALAGEAAVVRGRQGRFGAAPARRWARVGFPRAASPCLQAWPQVTECSKPSCPLGDEGDGPRQPPEPSPQPHAPWTYSVSGARGSSSPPGSCCLRCGGVHPSASDRLANEEPLDESAPLCPEPSHRGRSPCGPTRADFDLHPVFPAGEGIIAGAADNRGHDLLLRSRRRTVKHRFNKLNVRLAGRMSLPTWPP